ncbi:scribble [Carabus blaptoides fortunei]
MSKIDVIHDLANRNLCSLPDYVLKMTNLKMLFLEGNELTALPPELFTCLDKLVWLDVRNNKLTGIPETVMNHRCLQTILLQENQIEKLPIELGFLPKLKVLHLSGNPILYPPKTILEQGLPTIQTFLRNEFKNQSAENSAKPTNHLTNVNGVSLATNDIASTTNKCLVEMPIVSLKSLYKNEQRKKESKKSKSHTTSAKLNIYKDNPYSNSNKYLHMLPTRRNVYRISEQALKDIWMKKLKEIMSKQDETLQREKSKNAIQTWRYSTKFKNKNCNLSYRPDVPFDYDQEYDSMPTRYELRNKTLSTKRSRHLTKAKPKSINVEKLISDIIQSLNDLEEEKLVEKSPRTQMGYAGREIQRIVELQKRLSTLKLTNDRSV